MEKQLFRKKSLEKISSPDQLDHYLKVASPSVWIILLAVLVFLAGAIGWSYFGKLDTTIDTVAVTENGETYVYVSEEDYERIALGMKVTIDDKEYSVAVLNDVASPLSSDVFQFSYILHYGKFEENQWVHKIKLNGVASDIEATLAKIVVESVAPSIFITN